MASNTTLLFHRLWFADYAC